MKRFARPLCLFGSILLACAILVLYVFEYTPYPWGAADTPLSWLGDDPPSEKTGLYQAHVYLLTIAAAAVGIGYLLVGAALHLASYLKSRL